MHIPSNSSTVPSLVTISFAFSACILPSLYHTDLDRGFSVIDYSLNRMYASGGTLEKIKKLGIELKLDFILNHASVLSKQFQDIVAKGEESEYKDFFINWNKFLEGLRIRINQIKDADGSIKPDEFGTGQRHHPKQ